MIIWDTETTGLPQPEAMPLSRQPQIIEFAGIKLCDRTLKEVARLEFLVDPGKPLEDKIIEITGLTDAKLKGAGRFSSHALKLAEFFHGERIHIAHNNAFDLTLLTFEIQRMGLMNRFPWPIHAVCTVEQSMSIKGRRMKLSELYKHFFGKDFAGAHRAMVDVEALTEVVLKLIENGMIDMSTYLPAEG